MTTRHNATVHRTQRYTSDEGLRPYDDLLATEAPLQIKLRAATTSPMDYAVLMRTPGHDIDLLRGLLFSESVVHDKGDIQDIRHFSALRNIDEYLVTLRDSALLQNLAKRHLAGHSGCGVCSTESAERLLRETYPLLPLKPGTLSLRKLLGFHRYLIEEQTLFSRTGGSHATLFLNAKGELLLLREDVGRHNAFDKAIGYGWFHDMLQEVQMALVSGRLSFEIVHKTLKSGIPVLAGLGAPSSMAVDLAHRNNLTLVGFLHRDKCNVYTHPLRLIQ